MLDHLNFVLENVLDTQVAFCTDQREIVGARRVGALLMDTRRTRATEVGRAVQADASESNYAAAPIS